MSDTNYLLYFEVKKKIIGSQEKFGSVGKQQTNNFSILALFSKQAVKMQKPKLFENTNNFGTTLFLTF